MQPLDAERVKEWRHRRMLSQQEVADRAGTSLFTVQRIERGEGNVRPKTGRGVAAALGIPIEELLPKPQTPQPSLEDAARPEALQEALALLFQDLARQGQAIVEQSLRVGPSEALSKELAEYHADAAALYRIKGRRDIFGRDSDEVAEAEAAYQEVEDRIQAMLRQDVEATKEERSHFRKFIEKNRKNQRREEPKADAS